MAITEKKLDALYGKKRKSTIELSDRDGLVVSCGLSGKLSWVYRYRFNKQQKRLTLGSYPAMSLASARDKTIECVRALENGEDPRYASSKGEYISIEHCASQWIEKLGECPKRPDWSKEIVTILEMRETMSVINIAKHYGVPTKNIHSLIYFYRKHPEKIKR